MKGNENKKKILNKFEKINFKELTINMIFILLGTFVMALGFKIFLTPHRIVPGGFMGIAQILYDLLLKVNFSYLSVATIYIILNIFLYVYAAKIMGVKFAIRVGLGILSYSLFVSLIEQTSIVESINSQFVQEEALLTGVGMYILYALYGGILMGIGLGLVFRGNASTGGSDLVAIIVNKFFPTITTGQIVIFVDGIVVVLSAFAYQSLILPLYALITIFVCGKISDMFIDGVKSLRAFYIITEKKEEMAQMIINYVGRGVTDIKCEGMYTHLDRDMLMVIVRRSQVMKLKQIVKNVDENSFMFSSVVKEAYGKGFFSYSIKKLKKVKNGEENK